MVEIKKRNEILVFSKGPGCADSEMAKHYLALKQTSALKELKDILKKKVEKDDTNQNVLFKAFVSIDD